MMRLTVGCFLGAVWLLTGMLDLSSAQRPVGPVPAAPVPAAPVPETSAPLVLVLTVAAPSAAAPLAAAPAQSGGVSGTAPGVVVPASGFPVNQAASVKAAEFVVTISETPVAPEVARSLQAAEAARSAALPASNSPASFPRGEPAPGRKSYVDLSAAPCFAHAPDYNWIIGQVEYSSVAKEWRLRYASVDETDRYGGRVSLIENYHAGLLREGMYVQVRGHLVNPDNDSNRPTFYRIESYRNVDNPNVEQTSH